MKDFSKINIFILFLLFISIQSIDPKAKEVNNLSKGNNTQKKTGKKTIPINTYNQPKNRTTTNNKNNKNNINNNRYRRIYDIINQYKRSRQNNNYGYNNHSKDYYKYDNYRRYRNHCKRSVPGAILFSIWISVLILYFLVNRRKKTFNVMLNAGGNNLPNYMNV